MSNKKRFIKYSWESTIQFHFCPPFAPTSESTAILALSQSCSRLSLSSKYLWRISLGVSVFCWHFSMTSSIILTNCSLDLTISTSKQTVGDIKNLYKSKQFATFLDLQFFESKCRILPENERSICGEQTLPKYRKIVWLGLPSVSTYSIQHPSAENGRILPTGPNERSLHMNYTRNSNTFSPVRLLLSSNSKNSYFKLRKLLGKPQISYSKHSNNLKRAIGQWKPLFPPFFDLSSSPGYCPRQRIHLHLHV